MVFHGYLAIVTIVSHNLQYMYITYIGLLTLTFSDCCFTECSEEDDGSLHSAHTISKKRSDISVSNLFLS